jgi:ABC-type bacteriocin/lantibiotic exporter with double-glycine peptidase domain
MAGTEIEGLKGIQEKIVNKVRTSFFELLPADKFSELVEKEMKAFFEVTTEDFVIKEAVSENSYFRSDRLKLVTPISPFRAIVWAECQNIVNKKLEGVFTEEGFYSLMQYDQYGPKKAELSEKLKEVLRSQAQELATTFFSSMFAQAFNSATPALISAVKDQIKPNY